MDRGFTVIEGINSCKRHDCDGKGGLLDSMLFKTVCTFTIIGYFLVKKCWSLYSMRFYLVTDLTNNSYILSVNYFTYHVGT
jgi:hypothetical protein